MLKRGANPVRKSFRVASSRAFPGQLFERLLRRERGIVALLWILISELVEREPTTLGDLECACQRLRITRKQPVHLVRWFEITVGVTLASIAERVDRDIMPDAGDHILQDASAGLVKEHVIGDDGRDLHHRGEVRQVVKTKLVVRPAAQRQRHIGAIAERLAHAAQVKSGLIVGHIRHENSDQAVAIGDDVRPFEMALGLAGTLLAERQQPTQARISRTIGWIDEQRGAVGEIETAAHDEAYAGRLRRLMGPHDARQTVTVHDGQRLDALQRGLREQLLRR